MEAATEHVRFDESAVSLEEAELFTVDGEAVVFFIFALESGLEGEPVRHIGGGDFLVLTDLEEGTFGKVPIFHLVVEVLAVAGRGLVKPLHELYVMLDHGFDLCVCVSLHACTILFIEIIIHTSENVGEF